MKVELTERQLEILHTLLSNEDMDNFLWEECEASGDEIEQIYGLIEKCYSNYELASK